MSAKAMEDHQRFLNSLDKFLTQAETRINDISILMVELDHARRSMAGNYASYCNDNPFFTKIIGKIFKIEKELESTKEHLNEIRKEYLP